jgi:hypothetical protein
MTGRPEGVRIVHPDGSVVLCEVAFDRVDPDGTNVWSVMSKFDWEHGDHVEIEHLPAMTGVEFPLASWPGQPSPADRNRP